jgi:hypothetical protein
MIEFKKYIAEQLIGKKIHFKCECLFPINHIGVIKDYEIIQNEIMFVVDLDGKVVKIGENHPNLLVKAI